MELREALSQISEIHQQMARSEVFRGYRSITVGFSGVLGVLAAAFQTRWMPSPEQELERYLVLWCGVAVASLGAAGVELYWRTRRTGPGLAKEMTQLAVGQFLPAVVVGGLLTCCIYRAAPEVAWMLPGLWSLIFGLGVFASYRLLPGQAAWRWIVLCRLWMRMLNRGTRRIRFFSLANGYHFWRRSIDGRLHPVLDIGAFECLAIARRVKQRT